MKTFQIKYSYEVNLYRNEKWLMKQNTLYYSTILHR